MLITSLLTSLQTKLRKKISSMKRFIASFVLILFSLFALNAQTQTDKQSDDTLRLNVQIKASDIKLPIQDVSSIYAQINELKTSNKTEYDVIKNQLDFMSNKMDNIVHRETDSKLEYIASNFGMTKDDIKSSVIRSNINKTIAIVIPSILIVILWVRLYRVRNIRAVDALVYILLGVVLAVSTGFLIYLGLESLFNKDIAILNELKNLL